MIKILEKILSDTLQINGKYSRKSLTMLVSFGFCVFIGLVDMFTIYKCNDMIFLSFMGMAMGQTALTMYDKKKQSNISENDKEK